MHKILSKECQPKVLQSELLVLLLVFGALSIVLADQYVFAQSAPTVSNITSFVAEFNDTKIEIPFPEGWAGIKMNNASMNFANPNGYDPQTMQPKMGAPLDKVALQINPGDVYQYDVLPLKGYDLSSFAEYITKVPDDKKQRFLGFTGCQVVSESLVRIKAYDSEKTSLQCGPSGIKMVVYSFASDNRFLILMTYAGTPAALDHHLPGIEQSLEKINITQPTNPKELISSVSKSK